MAGKLAHLPTRPTMVKPESGEPFVRRQHVNLIKKQPKERNKAAEEPIKEPANTSAVTETPIPEGHPTDRIKSDNIDLASIESEFIASLPKSVKESELENVFAPSSKVYKVNPNTEQESFYKPHSGEDPELRSKSITQGTFYDRQVLAYEQSKMLGADGLIAPSAYYEPEITDKSKDTKHTESTKGSVQLSAHVFGKKFHKLSNTRAGWSEGNRFKETINDIDNIQDLMVFDFMNGETDRHGFNLIIGDKPDGWKKMAIGIDEGCSSPDVPDINDDWDNSILTWRHILRSERATTPISDKFQKGILTCDDKKFTDLCKKHNQSDEAISAALGRIHAIKEYSEKKFADLKNWWAPEDFSSMEEYKDFLKERSKITPYDIAQIVETKYNRILI